jgi:superfamily I DNA/RNA helicase
VVDLADRKQGAQPAGAPGFKYFVPLPEILAQVLHTGPTSVKVEQRYHQLIPLVGNEYNLVEKLPLETIEKIDPYLARAVSNIREGKVTAQAGYDGEFGVIQALTEQDFTELAGQTQFFATTAVGGKKKKDHAETRRKSGVRESASNTVFTPAQEKIINAPADENILVHAGPGSGKTRVLVERIRQLMSRGVAPESVLVLTFTNRAVDEIKQRLDAARIQVATFHGFCLSVLRDIRPGVTQLYHEPERTWALRKLFPALALADIQKAVQRIGTGTLDEADAVTARYRVFLQEQPAFDIGLIIDDFIALDRQGLLATCKKRYQYILVDEFQDINAPQHALLLLFHPTARFFVIGDPDQAIYAWRGARPDLFFDFAAGIKAVRYRLDTNFRSRPNILGAAAVLIAHNRNEHLEMKTSAAAGLPIEFLQPDQPADEARQVTARIEELLGGTQMHRGKAAHLAPADIAVLYRGRMAGMAVRAELANAGIPTEIRGEDWLENPALRLVLACVRQRQEPGLFNVLNILTAAEMVDRKTAKGILACGTLEEAAVKYKPVQIIIDTIQTWHGMQLRQVVEAVYENFRTVIRDEELLVRQLAGLAGRFQDDPARFLETVNANPFLMTDDVKPQGLVLSTFHGAKGLEFGAVFIVGAVDGITPSVYNPDLEEERRLFYVAMTRAKERLFISSPARMSGQATRISGQPSRFVDEIKAHLTEKKDPRARQLKLF